MKMIKYLFKKKKVNFGEVSLLRSFIIIIIWTLLFAIFGFYVNKEVCDFTDRYTYKVEVLEKYIEDDDLDLAKSYIINLSKSWHKEKKPWYKLLNHENFDSICMYLNIIEKSIDVNDKSKAFEYIEKIKITLDSISESEKCDLNHIM